MIGNTFTGRLSYWFLIVLLLPLLLASPTAAAKQSSYNLSGIDGGRAVLSLNAKPLHTMTPTPFHLTLTDHAGNPLTGLEIFCELDMPEMAMPENKPKISEIDGTYWGEAVFTMAGEWRMTIHVTLPNGRREILIFDIDRVLMK